MTLREFASHAAHLARRKPKRSLAVEMLERYQISTIEKDTVVDRAHGELSRIFFAHRGRVISKWVHYLEIYERHFAPFRIRDAPVTMLEIGVAKGGSLQMWREYFGGRATIFGVDIDPNCANRVSPPNQVRIGSQDDPDFLRAVIAEMGAPDIILDDGSHIPRHQRASFDVLFPELKYGGLYVIEDLHTAYWPGGFKGGYRRRGTAIELVKDMIDDLHAWYHRHSTTTPGKDEIGAIHVYDSMVVIEKLRKWQPGHLKVGETAADRPDRY